MTHEIQLKPVNSRLKRLINDFGDIWIVVQAPRAMHCFNGALGITVQSKCQKKVSNLKIGFDITLETKD